MATIQQIHAWLTANGASETADIALGVGSTVAEVQAILDANSAVPAEATSATPFILAGGGNYAANAAWVEASEPPPATTTMEDALAAILCDPCPVDGVPHVNEIKLHLDAAGVTPAQAQAGLNRVSTFITLAACSGLRTKLLAKGVPAAEIDAYFAEMQHNVTATQALLDHYGDVAV